MHGVPTWHFVRGIPGTEQIFLTDRTIGHVLSSLAIVIIKEKPINAHATIVTVPKVFPSTHPTKPTFLAVIRGLVIGHPQITYFTMVGTKLRVAAGAKIAVIRKETKQRENNHDENATTNMIDPINHAFDSR